MICQGDVQPEAEQVAQMVKDRFGISQSLISYTGPVIGVIPARALSACFSWVITDNPIE